METTPASPVEDVTARQEGTLEVIGSQGRKSWHKVGDIRPYDFRTPAFLAPTELRKLRQRHDEFVRSLAARLSIYLRLEISLEISRLQTTCYQNFAETLSTPAHVVMFKAEPLRGICLLDIPPRLGLTIVDRLLGGVGQAPAAHRDLTEIETALLDQGVQVMLKEWCNHWQPLQDLRPALLGYETNGRFLQTAPHDTMMVCLAVEVRIGQFTETLQFAFPHYTLEPIVRQLTSLSVSEPKPAYAIVTNPTQWNPELNDVPVTVAAEWCGLQLTARELVALKPGDVLLLDPQVTQSVQVSIGSTPKFQARLGTRGTQWAVQLTQPLPY